MTTTKRFRTGPIYGTTAAAPSTARYLLLFDTGSGAIVYRFAPDGTMVDEVGRGDGSEIYGPLLDATGRFLGYDGTNGLNAAATTIRSVNPVTGRTETHSIPSGRVAGAPTWDGASVRWMEYQPDTYLGDVFAHAMRAPFDLGVTEEFATPLVLASSLEEYTWRPYIVAAHQGPSAISAVITFQGEVGFGVTVYATHSGATASRIGGTLIQQRDPGRLQGFGDRSLVAEFGTAWYSDVNAQDFGSISVLLPTPPGLITDIAPDSLGGYTLLATGPTNRLWEVDSAGATVTGPITIDTAGTQGSARRIYPLY